jgi:hypothetical protein
MECKKRYHSTLFARIKFIHVLVYLKLLSLCSKTYRLIKIQQSSIPSVQRLSHLTPFSSIGKTAGSKDTSTRSF